MSLLCISIQAPSTPGPSFMHVCLLSFVFLHLLLPQLSQEEQEQEKAWYNAPPDLSDPVA
jgi:hypothetical protein